MAYTSLERSLNARGQPRDKVGRWVTTGASLLGDFIDADGVQFKANNLKAIGGSDEKATKIRAYVANNDYADRGLKEGDVIEIEPKNAELQTGARLDREFLEKKGIDPDVKHTLPDDVASQPQNVSDLNIQKASDLDKEMALGGLTDEEDAEFRKEREAEPLAQLPPALAEKGKLDEEELKDIVSGEEAKSREPVDTGLTLKDSFKQAKKQLRAAKQADGLPRSKDPEKDRAIFEDALGRELTESEAQQLGVSDKPADVRKRPQELKRLDIDLTRAELSDTLAEVKERAIDVVDDSVNPFAEDLEKIKAGFRKLFGRTEKDKDISDAEKARIAEETRRAEAQEMSRDDKGRWQVKPRKPRSYPPEARTKAEKKLAELRSTFGVSPYEGNYKDLSDEELVEAHKGTEPYTPPAGQIGMDIGAEREKEFKRAAIEAEMRERGIDPLYARGENLQELAERRKKSKKELEPFEDTTDIDPPAEDLPKYDAEKGYRIPPELNPNGLPPYGPSFPGRPFEKFEGDLIPPKYRDDEFGWPAGAKTAEEAIEMRLRDWRYKRTPKTPEQIKRFEEGITDPNAVTPENYDEYLENKAKLVAEEQKYYAEVKGLDEQIDSRWEAFLKKDDEGNAQVNLDFDRDKWNELKAQIDTQRAEFFRRNPSDKELYDFLGVQDLWDRTQVKQPTPEQMQRLKDLEDNFRTRRDGWDDIQNKVGAPINVGMDDIFFDDDDSSMDLDEPQEPVLDTPEEPKVKADPENPGNPVGPPSEKNTEEKLEAEANAEPVEEETPKKSLDEIKALGTAEEYVEDFDGLTPSEEQTNILNAIVKGKFRTVVKALAGTGKTTTLVAAAKAIARRRPGSRILSLQFNRKNAQEAGERMPRKNSEAVTVDAFAFRSIKNDNVKLSMNPTWQDGEVSGKATSLIGQKKPWVLANDDEVAKYFTYDEMPVYDKNLNATQVASMVRQIVDDFSHGTDDEITEEQVKKTLSRLKPDGDDVKAPSGEIVKKFKKYSEEYWENITSDKKPEAKEEGDKWTYDFKRVRVSNSHITKMWALSKPDLSNYRINERKLDTIFFDEGQDAIPAVAKVLADQDPERVQVIHVGDPNQAIYEWRGAINALDRAGAKADAVLPLTTVRRFGPELAGPGNAALNLLGYEEGRVRALGEGGEVTDRDSIPVSVDDDTVVLTRSNAGGIGEIAKFIAQDKMVGVTTEFYEDIESAVFHLKWLGSDFKTRGKTPKNANGEKVINSDLAGLRSKKDLYQLAENDPESRAAKYKILFERLGNGNFDAGLAYVEQNILPGIVTYSDGERPQNKVSGDFTGKVGENAVVSEDSRGNTLTLSVDQNFIKLQGPSAMYTHELKNGDSLKTFLKSGGWKPHRDTDGKWYYRISVKNYSEARRARDLNAVFDQIPEHLRPKDIQDRPKPDVKVSTTHRMKGLEADNVIIGEDFPEPGTLENGAQELPNDEELRTAYVALTRARKRMSLGSLAWVRDFQGPEGVAPANKAKDRDANVGAEAWKAEGIQNVAFSPSSYMSDDDLFDDLDDVDVDDPEEGRLPEFEQNIRTTRRTNVEDIDPDAEDGAYIVDPETGKNVRITSSDGDDENVFLDGYDEDNEDYQATIPRGQKVNQIEFGEPVRRQPEPEPERPEPARPVATPEPRPIARKPEPGKKASQIEEGDELLDDDGNVIGKVTGVRKGKLGDGTEVVAVEHDGPEKKVVYERSEDVKLRRPGKPATPEQAEEDKQTLIDDIKGADGTDLDVPPELLDTPSFVETWIKTKNGTYTKYFGGERWNVKENKDGTITLRPRSNPRDSKKYDSWEELEADFDNQLEESFKLNQEKLVQIARDRYGSDSYLEKAIKANTDPKQLARMFERDDAIQDALENGDLSVATLAARFNRYSDSFQARKGQDPLEEIIPDRKRVKKDHRPDPDAPTTPAIEQEDERRQEESDKNKERAEELERDATDEDEDYADEVEEEFTPSEDVTPELEDGEEEEDFEIPEGKVVTPAGLIDEDLNRPDDGSDITERSPFSSRLADLPEDEGMNGATPEQIKQQLMEEYPAAKIREDGAIVIHRKTYRDEIGPDAGKEVKVELFTKETKNGKMVIGVSKEVDGQKETYYHYKSHHSLKSLTSGGGRQGAAGIEQQLDRLTRTEADIDSDMTGKSAQAIRTEKNNYGGASGYFNYMRRNRAAALDGAGGNAESNFKLRTPEEHAQMVLSGRSEAFQTKGEDRYRIRFGKKASIYEAFQNGDQEKAAAIYQAYVNNIPDTPEARDKAKAFFEQSMREKFPGAKEKEMSHFLAFADSRVDSSLTAVDRPRETHMDRQGNTLRVGDYVEWTNNEGVVSRGQVVELKAVENPNEGAYAYSDYAEVKFLGKTKPQALNTNNMTKADDQESPVNNYQHWVRQEELAYNRKDKIGWEYDYDNKLFYMRDTGEIIKDFRAEERNPGDYDRIQGEIYKKIAENPELNPTKPKPDTPEADRPSPEESEAADDTANIFDGSGPVPERQLKRVRSLAEKIDDDSITDPEDKRTIEEAKNPKTVEEFERAKEKLRELYNRRLNLKQKNTPITPTEKGITGKASAFEGVDGFDNIPRYNGMSAFRDDNQSAEIKGSNARVVKPTPEAEQEVDNALEMGEDIRNRAAEIYQKYAPQAELKRSYAERYQRDANEASRVAALEQDPSKKTKLEKEATLAQGKADRANGEADNLVRRSMIEALEEQGVEFYKVSFSDVLNKARIREENGNIRAVPTSDEVSPNNIDAKAIDEATKFIPRPILEQMKQKIMDTPGGKLYVGRGGEKVRGFLGDTPDGQIVIRLTDDGISIRPDLKKSESSTRGNTALHELWHLAQKSSPDVTALETAYLYRRAAKKDENGNDVFELENIPSTETEGSPEVALKGTGFSSPYTGRMYGEKGEDVPGLVVNSPSGQNELGTTLIESMFGIGNDNYSQGAGRYAVGKDANGDLVYYLDSLEGASIKGISALNSRVKKGYYNEADGLWYEDAAFSNPVKVMQTNGRAKGESDTEAQNFFLGMMLRFGKRK